MPAVVTPTNGALVSIAATTCNSTHRAEAGAGKENSGPGKPELSSSTTIGYEISVKSKRLQVGAAWALVAIRSKTIDKNAFIVHSPSQYFASTLFK
jgi:hypothetical protein